MEVKPSTETGSGDDRALVERSRRGDEQAFVELVTRYKRPILNFAYRFLGDAHAADDVAQEVFIKAYRGLGGFSYASRHAKFSTWLFQIARNAAIDALRRRSRNPAQTATADTSVLLESLPAAGSMSQEIAAHELGMQIAAAVTSLPEDQRTAVVFAEYEGLSTREIADVMRCSVKSVEARLYRARQTLRHALRGLLR